MFGRLVAVRNGGVRAHSQTIAHVDCQVDGCHYVVLDPVEIQT